MLAVIMAGGHGTRLWPLSTKEKPKQFQKLLGNKTLLQATYERLSYLKPEHIFVSTNAEFAELVSEQLPELPKENIIIEPLRRDTGPAMAFVTDYLAKRGYKDEVLTIVYADHYIPNTEEFQKKLELAQALAKEQGNINIIQVKAKEPNTQLGYVKIGEQIADQQGQKVYKLDHFVEKPDLDTAKKYADSLDYLWNTGLYTWHIGNFLNLLNEHTPEIAEILDQIDNHNDCEIHYEKFPKISIDYALMEKLSGDQVHIIPADFTWSDVGNWHTIHNHLQDETSNVIHGNVKTLDTNNSIIYAHGPQKVVTIGIQDLAIITTEDTILICPKTETNRLKKMVEDLEEQNGK